MTVTNDWRTDKTLQALRQTVTCPNCGGLVSTESGYSIHKKWHARIDDKLDQIAGNFQAINDYVRGTGGMEDQIRAAIADDRTRITAIEQEIVRPTTGIRARLTALETALKVTGVTK